MMREFKVDDEVYDYRYGSKKGVVTNTDPAHRYPIKVYFDGIGTRCYTKDGKETRVDTNTILFHNPVKIVEIKHEYKWLFYSMPNNQVALTHGYYTDERDAIKEGGIEKYKLIRRVDESARVVGESK